MAAGVCLLEHPLPLLPPSSSSSSILFFEVSWFLYVRQVNENHAEERREVDKQLCSVLSHCFGPSLLFRQELVLLKQMKKN